MITPSTNSVVTARFAGAMYNQALNYSTTQQVLASTSTPGAMTDLENQLFIRDFSNMATSDVATIVATNLGLTGEAFDAAVVFLTGWITGTVFTERGAVIAQIVNNFSLMTEDPTFGSFATAWNARVGNAVAYAQNPSSTATIAFPDVPSANLDSFTLTNGTDIATANIFTAGLVYTPGGDDRINALQDEDQLTGTGTAPTLNATLGNANDNGAPIITPKLTGIEVVNVAFTGSGANVTALDMQDATGVNAVNITRVAQAKNAEVGNLKQPVGALSLSNTNANQADTVEFSYASGVLAGLNAATMTLNSVDLGTLNIGQNVTIAGLGVATNGIETLGLVSNGSTNTVRTLNLPMDTGTAGSITITGDQSLTLASTANVVNQASNVLVEAISHGGGVLQANGRLASIDASGMTGTASLTLNIAAGTLTTGKAGTSGLPQNVSITGTANNDTFYLYDTVQAGDSLLGGLGTDTIVVYTGGVSTGSVTAVEAVDIQLVGNVTMDMDKITDAATINIRNIDNTSNNVNGINNPPVSWDNGNYTVTLNNLTAAQGAGLSIQHSTTNNGSIIDTTVVANLKSSTNANDLVGITINEGVNTDPRFNFTLQTNGDLPATAAVERVESLTVTDSDTESNTVELELATAAGLRGTITLSGGVAGTFLNLDVDTTLAPADAQAIAVGGALVPNALLTALAAAKTTYDANPTVANKAALEAAIIAANNVTGLKQVDVTGTAVDGFGWVDVGASTNMVRLVAGTINAANEASDVTIRVSTTAANTNGGQAITMGAGNDTVIFDDIAAASPTRSQAGLTNADTVVGGAGNNTLVIDGNGVNVILQQSEWDNVSGFQTVYLAGNGAGNQYFLQIDNDMITANGTNGNMIVIDNDDDSTVSTATNADVRTSNTALRLDATTLSANQHFTYDGEEGAGATADRFVVNDQNTNGGNIIDGGDIVLTVGVDSTGVTRQLVGNRSLDVMEVRNTATVTTADLANVSNVGSIVINNDQAVLQTLNLTLNSAVADALSDSGHTASLTEIETLLVTANDGLMTDAAGTALAPVAPSRILMDARTVSGAFALTITGDAGFAANDSVTLGINVGGAAQTVNLNLGTDTLAFSGTAANVTFAAATVTFADSTGTATQVFNVSNTEILDFSAYVDTASTAPATAANTITYGTAVTGVTTLTIATSSTGTTITNTSGAALNITGGSGADIIVGDPGAFADVITGGAGADVMTGGLGADTFVFAAGASGLPTATNFDTITDYVTAVDIIDFGATTLAAATAGTSGLTINAAGLVTAGAANLAAFVAAVGGVAGAAGASTVYDNGVNSYLFISDGVAGLGANDVLVQLTGITGLAAGLTFVAGDITAIA
ncbi:hypothetical protein [Candidatus Accumulibacter cognatus]|uniref:Serralysin n=1 Tax=Candidatus Accumulibacter cognatus TaxID=2954383 RepID=A0A080MAC7_9PROT|nr:hypothetical protein [Candidatus Accumulibacter cognatus]KFB78193.1 MAG: Serralysin precursor [Candidatus Accumulibacter cognatus]QLH50170.1 MAG: hypothetical protein HWD57_10555 [Candidatus Accumulibacter cognatus]